MFKTPEMAKILADSMKTADARKVIMSSVTESMENPLFKLEIMKLLQSVVKEELTPDQDKKKEEKKAGQSEDKGGEASASSSPSSSPSSSASASASGG
jgi:spore germination protein D